MHGFEVEARTTHLVSRSTVTSFLSLVHKYGAVQYSACAVSCCATPPFPTCLLESCSFLRVFKRGWSRSCVWWHLSRLKTEGMGGFNVLSLFEIVQLEKAREENEERGTGCGCLELERAVGESCG